MSFSIYSFASVALQIPNTIILEKIGKKNAIVLGQLLNLIAMILIMWCPNFLCLIISKIISAAGLGIKGIAESNFLNCSLPKTSKRGEIFSKIDSKGYARYCYICATSVLISGFLYSVNPYIPIVLCLIFNTCAIILATNFIDVEKIEEKELAKKKGIQKVKSQSIKQEVINIWKDLQSGFSFIFKSSRLRTLLIMLGILWGLISLFVTYQETILKEMEISPYYIGIILASFQFLVGISSTKSIEFHNKFRNKSLTIVGLGLTVGSIIAGLTIISPLPFPIQLMLIVGVFILRAYVKGVYQVNKKRYIGNFADKEILPKIYSVNGIFVNLGGMVISFIGSSLLRVTTTGNASLIAGIGFSLLIIFMYFYMKKRVGLKPEEYRPEEISYNSVLQEK